MRVALGFLHQKPHLLVVAPGDDGAARTSEPDATVLDSAVHLTTAATLSEERLEVGQECHGGGVAKGARVVAIRRLGLGSKPQIDHYGEIMVRWWRGARMPSDPS
jgi:hypothetical protein